ncbi:MAG: hypothetical protein JW915_11775 [Chitinispirillaceae bacterium]|nr:hypothetical protein [Chitinispirillaceae bacterium]
MIDIILKIIDRCIDLIKRKEEVNRDLFTDFVKPIQDDFDQVHENYMISFKKYRDMMDTVEHPVSSDSILFKSISEDSVFSYYDRAKLHLLKRYSNHTVFGQYIKEIRSYLILSNDANPLQGVTNKIEGNPKDIYEENLRMNAPRFWTINQIIEAQKEQGLNKENYRDLAICKIDEMVLTLQQHHERIYQEYLNLKDKLLTKI